MENSIGNLDVNEISKEGQFSVSVSIKSKLPFCPQNSEFVLVSKFGKPCNLTLKFRKVISFWPFDRQLT